MNTLIGKEEARLMPFNDFRKEFADDEGFISDAGQAYFFEKAKGLISYLNREFDPTTFAQPVFHKILVPLEGKAIPTAEEIAQTCNVKISEQNDEGLSPKSKRKHKKNMTRKQKARKQEIKSCYLQTRKDHEQKHKGQIHSLEKCFGKESKFPSLKEVMKRM